jgi:hypothetical protein
MEKAGRRPLLLYGMVGMGISAAIITIGLNVQVIMIGFNKRYRAADGGQRQNVDTYNSKNMVAGHFAERHFVERHFAERHFVERHFAERHFAERTFCRTDILTNGHFAENRDIF